jgi:hypothetical protein
LRVFLQDGSHDLDNLHGNWPLANQEMAAALKFMGYDHKFVFGEGNAQREAGRRAFCRSPFAGGCGGITKGSDKDGTQANIMSETEPSCSFCHQPQSKVRKLIASDSAVHICNYCVALCHRVLVKEGSI